MTPLPGARAFLDALRERTQVVILSDTFEEFARPLMAKLGWPTLLCNSLEVAPSGEILRHRMRCENSKLTTVRALQSCGYETIAAGDSFNDLAMIRASNAGFSLPQHARHSGGQPGPAGARVLRRAARRHHGGPLAMPRLYILRHGQTEFNLQKRVQGHCDSPLTPPRDGAGARRGAWLVGRDLRFDRIAPRLLVGREARSRWWEFGCGREHRLEVEGLA